MRKTKKMSRSDTGPAHLPGDAPADERHEPSAERRYTRDRSLVSIPASSIKSRRLRWLWEERIVVGALNLFAGREGLGKSTVMCDVIAKVTNGELEGEYYGHPRDVLYVLSEDRPEEIARPRLEAARADLGRVHFVEARDGGHLTLPDDIEALGELVTVRDAVLVVLDPIKSVISGKVDGDRDHQMRKVLEPLARKTGAAVLGIIHLNKAESTDSRKRISGTSAWSQVARSVLAIGADNEAGDLVITNTKSNFASGDVPSLSLRIEGMFVDTEEGPTPVSKCVWTGETERDAELLMDNRARPNGAPKRPNPARWLKSYLESVGGQAPQKQVMAAAEEVGLTGVRTLQRAAENIGVDKDKTEGPWVWKLPKASRLSHVSLEADTSARSLHDCRLDALSSSSPDAKASALRAHEQCRLDDLSSSTTHGQQRKGRLKHLMREDDNTTRRQTSNAYSGSYDHGQGVKTTRRHTSTDNADVLHDGEGVKTTRRQRSSDATGSSLGNNIGRPSVYRPRIRQGGDLPPVGASCMDEVDDHYELDDEYEVDDDYDDYDPAADRLGEDHR